MANQHTASPWPNRFWEKTRVTQSGCIEWIGHIDKHGYGRVSIPKTRKICLAHRVAFALAHARDPEAQLDHVCRNRRCVNAAHLREATPIENAANGRWALATKCANGHPWDKTNTYHRPDRPKHRSCRVCNRASVSRYQEAKP